MTDAALLNVLEKLAKAVCRCTIQERQSGHHVDCWLPDILDDLKELRFELAEDAELAVQQLRTDK